MRLSHLMSTPRLHPPRGFSNPTSLVDCSLDPQARVRVAVFGSFLGGFYVLGELCFGPLASRIELVGVATDDPKKPFTHPSVRLWKYPHSREDELMVPRLARAIGLPVFAGRVTTPGFIRTFVDGWRPHLCLMATFGQKIPDALIGYPTLGFYNLHHSADHWPSYPGPDPIAAMVRDRLKHLVLTLHKVTDVIDGGEFVARSHAVAIPDGVNAVEMHRITWPQMGPFIRQVVAALLDGCLNGLAPKTMPAHEERLSYRVRTSVGTSTCCAA